jgi:hypothetical protein
MAHRWAYESEVGPIPIGLTLDHLCKVRRCVRPDHLEAVTLQENLLRGLTFQASNAAKTRCPRGHPYTAQNTRHHCGSRHCKTCEWLARRGLKWAADIDHAEAYNLAMRAVTRRGRA